MLERASPQVAAYLTSFLYLVLYRPSNVCVGRQPMEDDNNFPKLEPRLSKTWYLLLMISPISKFDDWEWRRLFRTLDSYYWLEMPVYKRATLLFTFQMRFLGWVMTFNSMQTDKQHLIAIFLSERFKGSIDAGASFACTCSILCSAVLELLKDERGG